MLDMVFIRSTARRDSESAQSGQGHCSAPGGGTARMGGAMIIQTQHQGGLGHGRAWRGGAPSASASVWKET